MRTGLGSFRHIRISRFEGGRKDGILSPQSPSVLPCLSLISPEFLHVLKWKSCISKSIPLFDDFCIQEGSVQEIDIGQKAAISVPLLPVKFKAGHLPINHLLGEKIGLSSKVLDRFLRMFGFRGIHADQPDSLLIDKEKGVPIDDTLYLIYFGMGGGEKTEKD